MKNTEEKLAIMSAWVRGEPIAVCFREDDLWRDCTRRPNTCTEPAWNWDDYDFRITVKETPKPVVIPADNGAAMAMKGMNDAIMLGKLSAQIEWHKAEMEYWKAWYAVKPDTKLDYLDGMRIHKESIKEIMKEIQKLGT